MISTPLVWYVIYTYPNQERKVSMALLQMGLATYLPLTKVIRKWSDRYKTVSVPLFPNYLFVQVQAPERFKVLKAAGALRFVTFNGNPATLTGAEIAIIKQLGDANPAVEASLLAGDHVRITQGPFSGLEGLLLSRKGGNRFGVHLLGLRQTLMLEIDVNFLQKV